MVPFVNEFLPRKMYGVDQSEHVTQRHTTAFLPKPSQVDVAESLQLSYDKFTLLWNALKERFEVKIVIADEQILKLYNLKPMSPDSVSELRHMIDVVIKSLRLLETIDLKLDSLSEMFPINLLRSRPHEETRKAYQLQLKPTVYPKWSEMLTFLKARYHSLENYEQMSPTSMVRSMIQS
jgi:hypothetical protein